MAAESFKTDYLRWTLINISISHGKILLLLPQKYINKILTVAVNHLLCKITKSYMNTNLTRGYWFLHQSNSLFRTIFTYLMNISLWLVDYKIAKIPLIQNIFNNTSFRKIFSSQCCLNWTSHGWIFRYSMIDHAKAKKK